MYLLSITLLTLNILLDLLNLLADFRISRVLTQSLPVSKKQGSWVADGQCKEGCHDHGTIKDHERRFIVRSLRLEATRELNYTIDATDCDGDGSNAQSFKMVSLVRRKSGRVTYPR